MPSTCADSPTTAGSVRALAAAAQVIVKFIVRVLTHQNVKLAYYFDVSSACRHTSSTERRAQSLRLIREYLCV